MKLKKLLSVLLIMTLVLSACVVSQADTAYDYLVGPIDFTAAVGNSNTLGFSPYGQASVYAMDVDGSKALRINRGYYKYDSWVNAPSYDSTGKTGVVIEFKLKNTLNIVSRVDMNGSSIIKINTDGVVSATDSGKTLCNVKANEWYTYTVTMDYSSKNILFTVKDSSGNIICNTPHVQSAGTVANQMVAKADSAIRFYMAVMPEEGNYDLGYIDDYSVRAITADDLAKFPISVTTTGTIVEENYDGLSPEPITFPGGWSGSMYKSDWGLNSKGYIAGGKSGTASIKATSDGSTDKYLEFNLNSSGDTYLEYMYYNSLNKNNYIQELTFKVEENVLRMDFAYRPASSTGGATVATLYFTDDLVSLGGNSVEFDFVPGTIYTAKAYYAWDAHKGKIEITDGTKSVVLHGNLSGNKNPATQTEAPFIRFWNDNTHSEGRIISIYNYNIYSTNEESCELKTRYSNFKLSKDVFEEGSITASVDVESNASFSGYINNTSTLFLAVYQDGKLSELKTTKVSPEDKTFSVDNIIGASDTSVKAMLWNVDDGTLTPLFVSEELTK